MSRRIERLTGWSAAELCRDPQLFDGAIHADDRAQVTAARSRQGAGWTVTYRLQRQDGNLATLQETATVLDDSHDHYIVGTLTDVTDQQRHEQHTRLLAQGFGALIDHSSATLALVDEALGCVAASPGLAAGLGVEAAALQGQSLDQLQQAAQAAGLALAPQPLHDNGQLVGVLLLSAPPAPGRD
jgi:PAS domain S-box-containing protein